MVVVAGALRLAVVADRGAHPPVVAGVGQVVSAEVVKILSRQKM